MKHTEMIMVIEASSEGKAIQTSNKYIELKWIDKVEGGAFNFVDYDYRVKPEPKYRTIKSHTDNGLIEYVEIKALEDLMKLTYVSAGDMSNTQCDEWNEIENLIK